MDEHAQSTGLSRRELLKRSAIVGGLVWVAPTVLSSPADATTVTCPPAQRYAVRHDVPDTGCSTPGVNPTAGNCAALARFTQFNPGCCIEPGLVTFQASVAPNGAIVHTYVLDAGVGFVQGFGYCGTDCFRSGDPEPVVEHSIDPSGVGTVIISCSNLSHSELIACISGSSPPCP